MSTDFFRKYIDIINENTNRINEDVDPGRDQSLGHIVFATNKSLGTNDIDYVYKDLRTGKVVAYAAGSDRDGLVELWIGPNQNRFADYVAYGDASLSEFSQGGGGDDDGDDGGDDYVGNWKMRPQEGFQVYKIDHSKHDSTPTNFKLSKDSDTTYSVPWQSQRDEKGDEGKYYGYPIKLVSRLPWIDFLEKMIGKIMDIDDAAELGYIEYNDNWSEFYFAGPLADKSKEKK